MDEIRIRPATPADIPLVVHHRMQMFADMGSGTPETREAVGLSTATYLRDAMPSGRYRGWLAETAEGRVIAGVGIAISAWPGSPADPAPRRGLVINVYTEPEFRRRGIARRLMDTLVEWCRAERFGSVALHASVYGRALYEQMGFVPTNEMRLTLK
jgi:GNAT superfamily N-acetyltransferase